MSERPSWIVYPTPVSSGAQIGTEFLWIKNDGLTGTPYGGNKVRKLERLLADARAHGAERLVTAGAAGSHHVLATAVFGAREGFSVMAHLWPMPWSAHAEGTLRAAIAQGLRPQPVGSAAEATLRLSLNFRPRDYVIHIGGAGLVATLAYAAAAGELASDVTAGRLPEPERIVVPLGTGSTVAGLLAGIVQTPLQSLVVGVAVAKNPVARVLVLAMAARALRASGKAYLVPQLPRRLVVDASRVGAGYGRATAEGARATAAAVRLGIELEPTYTAKAFARALAEAGFAEFSRDFGRDRLEGPRRTLYWHTLSAHPLGPLTDASAGPVEIPEDCRSLFLDSPFAEAPRR